MTSDTNHKDNSTVSLVTGLYGDTAWLLLERITSPSVLLKFNHRTSMMICLPREVISQSLTYLQNDDLAKVALTCRTLLEDSERELYRSIHLSKRRHGAPSYFDTRSEEFTTLLPGDPVQYPGSRPKSAICQVVTGTTHR